jgi:hypothetical protein
VFVCFVWKKESPFCPKQQELKSMVIDVQQVKINCLLVFPSPKPLLEQQ